MAKQSVAFHCTNCDYRPPKWLGCCPGCNEWGSITERAHSARDRKSGNPSSSGPTLSSLSDIPDQTTDRFVTGLLEWDRVMGGGIVPGSFIIVSGDPGIGKSTLLLHIAHSLAAHQTVLYFSSEESLHQIKNRAQRIGCTTNTLLFSDQAHLESITDAAAKYKPSLIVIDSIQNCYSTQAELLPGTLGQLREAAFVLMRLAKEQAIAIIVTAHITKEGIMAGPKMLEHMVDAVFYLQGEEKWDTRVLRSVKNRFGSINELGFFQMEADGLHQVSNINKYLLDETDWVPGSTIVSYVEGSRPFLLELQALTVPSKFGIPQRIISGVDHKQVALIAAMLEKYLHIKLSTHDIFFKVSGGFKVKESCIDLGIALALLSSYLQKPLPEKSLALGELSLTGTIKPINQLSLHLNEALKFGFKTFLLAANQTSDKIQSASIYPLKNVYELLRVFEE